MRSNVRPSARWKKVLNDDSVRLATGRPRTIPRKRREEIASVLVKDMFNDRHIIDVKMFASRQGGLVLVLNALQELKEWEDIKEMAAKSDIPAIIALRTLTTMVLDIMDRSFDIMLLAKGPEEVGLLSELVGTFDITILSWQRNAQVTKEKVYESLTVLREHDSNGLVDGVLRQIIGGSLAHLHQELGTTMGMLEMIEALLPDGKETTISVEEVLISYLKDVDRFAELLRRSKDLAKIIELIGHMDVDYGAKKEGMTNFAASESYDLGLSKDIRHVLPVELIKLKDPTLKALFFSRLLEGELLTYELRGLNWAEDPDERRKGPVIALIDASGSMVGEPEMIAKALIIMMARRMVHEKRKIKVVLFASTDWKMEVDLTDRKKMAKDLLDLLCRTFEGNTDFNTALRVGLETVRDEKWGGSDLLFFTDGMSEVTDDGLVREWKDLKARTDSRIFTLIVGNKNAGGLEKVSDHTYIISSSDWELENSPSNIIKMINSKSAIHE